jgi:hypothetical protein
MKKCFVPCPVKEINSLYSQSWIKITKKGKNQIHSTSLVDPHQPEFGHLPDRIPSPFEPVPLAPPYGIASQARYRDTATAFPVQSSRGSIKKLPDSSAGLCRGKS